MGTGHMEGAATDRSYTVWHACVLIDSFSRPVHSQHSNQKKLYSTFMESTLLLQIEQYGLH